MTIRYVATNGNDNNPGTQAQPFLTVSKGLSVSLAGDILYLRQGTYTTFIPSSCPSGTSWSSPFTLASFPGEIATIFSNTVSAIAFSDGANIQYVVFDRLVLQGPGGGDINSTINGIYFGSGNNHLSFTRGEIKNFPQTGVRDVGDHNEITLCSIHDNFSHGYFGSGNTCIVDGNTIFNNGGEGIRLYLPGSTSVTNNIMRNNRVSNNGAIFKTNVGNPGFFLPQAITVSSGSNNLVYNNLVYDNVGACGIGVISASSSSGNKVYNNTVYHNETRGILLDNTTSGNFIINNICYLNTLDTILDQGSGNTLNNNYLTNPSFFNETAKDFRLLATSPAIDTGIAVTEVLSDILGVNRPQRSNYDPGAFEFIYPNNIPLVWWAFEELTGTIVNDKSGFGNTGTFVNSPTRITGNSGPFAIQFNGSTNYIQNTTFTWFANSPVTVCFWVFAPGSPEAGTFGIGAQNTPQRFGCHCTEDNNLFFDYGNQLTSGRIGIDFSPYFSTWVHVALVSAGINGAFKAIYINGNLIASQNSSSGPTIDLVGLEIGRWNLGSGTVFYHNGSLDDFQLFNTVLSREEILDRAHTTPPLRENLVPAFRPLLAF